MSLLLHILALHETVAGYLATPPGAQRALSGVPDPAPQAPPGLTAPVTTIIAWGKWGVLVCGVAGLLICAGKMAIGHRNRATFAADGATGVPWVLGGLSLAAVAAAIVSVFLS
jgi:hypothetical protein